MRSADNAHSAVLSRDRAIVELLMNINRVLTTVFRSSLTCGNASSALIRNELERSKPSMIARFGSVEIQGVLYSRLGPAVRLLAQQRVFSSMRVNAGFFPVTDEALRRFSCLMIDDMQLVDILGSWRIEERLLTRYLKNAMRIDLKGIEPYLCSNPWSEALAGLRVLVVHPFCATIQRQYEEKRGVLFEDKRVLPKFRSLQTVKAAQTIGGDTCGFIDWFEALESMKAAIDSRNFDVAVVGCGAYGFPLAAHIKRRGKKVVHMGGATQILFGIRGRRWDTHPRISALYNEHWVRPLPEEVPAGASRVEDGCYW
jgi:hypothetical protein